MVVSDRPSMRFDQARPRAPRRPLGGERNHRRRRSFEQGRRAGSRHLRRGRRARNTMAIEGISALGAVGTRLGSDGSHGAAGAASTSASATVVHADAGPGRQRRDRHDANRRGRGHSGPAGDHGAVQGRRSGHERAAHAAIRRWRSATRRFPPTRKSRGWRSEASTQQKDRSMRALAIAATGMSAQEQNLEVIANNIANLNTTGFKRSRAEFTDLIYQTERVMGVSSRGRDATVPEGAQVGLGVRTAAIRSLQIQGALTNTGNSLDLAINGRGWFQVTHPGGRHRLYPRRRVQHQRDGAIGDRRRLHGDAGDSDPADRDERHREPDGRGDRDDSRTSDAATARPVDDRQFHQRSRACRRWAAISSSKPRRRVSPLSAFPATRRSASSSRAIWKPRTSTRCRRSPT